MSKFNIGQRVNHKIKGIGTVVTLPEYEGDTYDVKYDNFSGRGNTDGLWYPLEENLSPTHKFSIGERVNDIRYGDGVVTDVPRN